MRTGGRKKKLKHSIATSEVMMATRQRGTGGDQQDDEEERRGDDGRIPDVQQHQVDGRRDRDATDTRDEWPHVATESDPHAPILTPALSRGDDQDPG